MSKINKALDLNKLFNSQKNGKLLKKHISFPLYAPTKYDGNYVTIRVEDGRPTFTTSGGLNYTHTDDGGNAFYNIPDNVYIAERIYGYGKLGDRNKCNLKGPKTAQTSTGHSYKIFDVLSLRDYDKGTTLNRYEARQHTLQGIFMSSTLAGRGKLIECQRELDKYLEEIVHMGYEGVMCIYPAWRWENTKSRTVDFCKYKKRPTVDLYCIGYTEGTGKYEGLIGSLKLQDKSGRIVDVGSGMSDNDRHLHPNYFVGQVVEMFYEQIVDTYIQPTFGDEYEGVLVREDKTIDDID